MIEWPDRPRWTEGESSRVRPHAGRRDWYRIEDLVTTDTTTIHVYDEIGCWGVSAADLVAELATVRSARIDLHLNSPGGEVWDGIAILEALRRHPAVVTTYVDSLAASVASVIAMAGSRIVMGRHAQLMIHDASGLAIGNAADMRSLADLLDRCSDGIAGVYAERSGRPVEYWRTAMSTETWYSADEAVAVGLADEVAVPVGGRDPVHDTGDLPVYDLDRRVVVPAPVVPDPLPATPVVDLSELLCSAIREAVSCPS